MKKPILILLVLICTPLFNESYADRRYFARSYLAYTLPMGALEFELWNTIMAGKDPGYYYRFQPRFEFEYGVLDQLSASFYFNFDQITAEENSYSSKNFTFASTAMELRCRLTDPDEIFIDPALYFEFTYGGDEIEYEGKTIFSKRIGNFITAVNLTGEIEQEVIESKNESAFELTAGIMYDLNPNLAFGLEFRNHRIYEGIYEEEENQAAFIGPTINVQTKSFYLTVNFMPQISGSPATIDNLDLDSHEKYEFRTILGIGL